MKNVNFQVLPGFDLSVGKVTKPFKMLLKWQTRNSSPYVNLKMNEVIQLSCKSDFGQKTSG